MLNSKSDFENTTDNEYEDELQGWIIDTSYSNVMGPYMHKGDQWISYDDVDIVRKKAEYVAENSLGGAINLYT